MSFPLVVAIAMVGGFLGNQFLFFLGKRYGDRVLDRFPRIAAKAPRVKKLLCRWDAPIIIGIRFMYGLRIAGPIIIGAAGISPWRLAIFNFIGAAIWAPLVAGFGYLSGFALEKILEDFQHRGIVVLVIVLLVAVLIVGYLVYRRRRRIRSPSE